jgi:starch-binding outer membrane protein, SusD/RagB family
MSRFKNIYLVLTALALAVTFSSCSDWLDLEPENDLIEDEFWRKTEDVEAMLASTYNSWRGNTLNNLIMGEVRGDKVRFTSSAFSDYNRIAQSDISTSSSRVDWSGYYRTINLANTLMHYTPLVLERDKTFSVAYKESIEAEALFLRSLSFFYLVRLWKEVPLVLNPMISDTVNVFLPKSNEHVVLDQIVADLKRAEKMAYSDKYQDQAAYYKGRANIYSIQTLLADIFLWQEKYDDCIEYCDKIISSGKFSLENQNNWFKLFYPGNSMAESIFEIQYSTAYKQVNPLFYDVIQLGGITPQLNMVATEKLSSLYNPTDIRLLNPLGKVAIPANKYASKDLVLSRRLPSENDANVIEYRYAEVLLMKAEALVEKGAVQEVNDILSLISDRSSGMYEPLGDIENLRSAVLAERAREFAGEGKRWFDILRYARRNNYQRKNFIINMILANAGVQQRPILESRVTDVMSYYLPIPEKELIYNPKLVQNPYYDR